MAQFVNTRTRTFTAGAAIGKYIRVKLSSGKLAAAGIGDDWIGYLESASFADGDKRSVILRNAQGTIPMVANAAIALGAAINTAANGKCDDATTSGFQRIGVALEVAGAQNDIIEVLPD